MKRLLLALTLIFAAYAPQAIACGCGGDSVTPLSDQIKWAVKESAAVFVGKVKSFEYRTGIPKHRQAGIDDSPLWETKTVIFSIDRWWKGDLGPQTLLITDEFRHPDGTRGGSSCDYHFEQDKTYLVFAVRSGEFLKTHACSFTRETDQAKTILDLLGKGKPPSTDGETKYQP